MTAWTIFRLVLALLTAFAMGWSSALIWPGLKRSDDDDDDDDDSDDASGSRWMVEPDPGWDEIVAAERLPKITELVKK